MKTYLKLFVFTGILSIIGISVQAGSVNSNVGTTAFPFLKINISARAVSMGGAFTGLANDESALYYNPAGITTFEQKHFILGYHNYFYDMQNGFAGYITPLGQEKALGFYIGYLNYGDFTETEENGTVIGNFSGGDFVFATSFAMKQGYNYSFGATAKFIYEKVQDYSATGTAVDIGAKYHSNRGRFGAGLMIQNLGFQLSALGREKFSLPTTIRGGISFEPRGLPMTLTSDLILPSDNNLTIAIGGEYFNFKPFYIRLGWNSFGSNYRTANSKDSWAGLTMGVGFDYKKMQLSYAYSPSAELGQSHRITITGEI